MPELLSVQDLDVCYTVRSWRRVPPKPVLHRVNLGLEAGRTLGLVGESGSGKTTIGRAILGLVEPAGGRILFDGKDITHRDAASRRALAGEIQVVFQDPYSSLNPALSVRDILAEPLVAQRVPRAEAHARIASLLERVGLPADAGARYARELSGGQRQRVAIARALALEPRLIVCDEPVSALDISTQARVLELFREIQQSIGVAYLFISHDLDVIRHVSDTVAVIAAGRIVESGPAGKVTTEPDHPYSKRLLLSAPLADPVAQRERRAQRLALTDDQGASRAA